jgi:hypothetical protein
VYWKIKSPKELQDRNDVISQRELSTDPHDNDQGVCIGMSRCVYGKIKSPKELQDRDDMISEREFRPGWHDSNHVYCSPTELQYSNGKMVKKC